MITPSPELEQRVRQAFAQLKPERIFRGCAVADKEGVIIVRVYSHHQRYPQLIPTPYQVFCFNAAEGTLNPLSREEAIPYMIQNYK